MYSKYIINSKEYWNFRFKSGSWDKHNGKGQTQFFMRLLIDNIPEKIFNDIKINKYNILDYACALGQGCEELYKSFNTEVKGLDFSKKAVFRAKELYPHLKFTYTSLNSEKDKYDIIVCSNVLEHLIDYKDYLELFSEVAQKYILILVPYKNKVFDEHVVSFDESYFPEKLNDFSKIFIKIINTDGTGFWNGNQFLIIYKKDG